VQDPVKNIRRDTPGCEAGDLGGRCESGWRHEAGTSLKR
jgi:hypothetical protein